MTRPDLRGAGRFAPTPTGRLHLGNVRTALLAWLWARAEGLRNVLRVEDLDPAAVPSGAIDLIYEDLDWLGLTFDEDPRRGGPVGPYLQSERFGLYEAPLARLAEEGLLYPCWCSRKEVQQAALAPHAGDEGPIYPGTCRLPAPTPLAQLDALPERNGRRPALRLDVSLALRRLGDSALAFDDAVWGDVRYHNPVHELGDFVVRRADRLAAYQLACAWDDAVMGCTQVLRGVDLLPSAARQVLLLRLLGLPEPRYAHVGLVLTANGEKLSKRDASIAIADLRARGLPPEEVISRLAVLSGLPAAGSPAELADRFAPGPALRESVRLPS